MKLIATAEDRREKQEWRTKSKHAADRGGENSF
jgi:hypothetical protein